MLRVGIIGASAERGWAREAHVPAVAKLAGLELAAVATSRQETAEAAAHAFGAARAYGDPRALVDDPAIGLVTVAVPVPAHRELVLRALAAGKHVYCEWPLGKSIAETEELAAAVKVSRAVIGLQARVAPAVLRAREIAGSMGSVLSARAVSTTAAFGPEVEAALAFAEEPANGVSLVTIQGAHTIDLVERVLGPLAEVRSFVTTQFSDVRVDGKPARRTVPDHLLVQGRLAGGGAASIEVAGGREPPELRFEITCERGHLALTGGAVRGFQSGRLVLTHDGAPVPIDEGELAALPDAAANVGAVYARLRDAIAGREADLPDFALAVRLRRRIDALLKDEWTASRR